MIYTDFSSLVGNTPLLKLEGINEELPCTLLAKLECFNPAGSVKDRVAVNMLQSAMEKGLIKKGDTVIEPTSGNTGIGLAAAAVSMGLHAILVMPDTMSIERQKLLKAYGAEIVLTEGAKGMLGTIEKAKQLQSEIEGSFIPSQFDNPDNPAAHEKTTGPEIYRDTEVNIDVFIACVGTGGTVSGTGRYLKRMKPDIEVIAVYSMKALMDNVLCSDKAAIVNVASSAALCSLAGTGAYSASKAALKSFTDAVREEHRGELYVGLICPGFTKTDIFRSQKKSDSTSQKMMDMVSTDCDKMVDMIMNGIWKKKEDMVFGMDAHLMHIGNKALGTLCCNLSSKVMKLSKLEIFKDVFEK